MTPWWQDVLATIASEFSDLPDAEQVTRTVLRLLLAALLGGLIGWERESKGKAAGLRGDRYEFWIYRQLRKRLATGELHLDDSVRHRRFGDELVASDRAAEARISPLAQCGSHTPTSIRS